MHRRNICIKIVLYLIILLLFVTLMAIFISKLRTWYQFNKNIIEGSFLYKRADTNIILWLIEILILYFCFAYLINGINEKLNII
jgi:hypothetical protein